MATMTFPQRRLRSVPRTPATIFPVRPEVRRNVKPADGQGLTRLFQLSLPSLHGYLQVRESGQNPDLTNFAGVVAWQRFAQCRELSALVGRLNYSTVIANQQSTTLRLIWGRALAELQREHFHRFLDYVTIAEERLEDACLVAAMQCESDLLRERLHAFAINICGAKERLEEILAQITRDPSEMRE